MKVSLAGPKLNLQKALNHIRSCSIEMRFWVLRSMESMRKPNLCGTRELEADAPEWVLVTDVRRNLSSSRYRKLFWTWKEMYFCSFFFIIAFCIFFLCWRNLCFVSFLRISLLHLKVWWCFCALGWTILICKKYRMRQLLPKGPRDRTSTDVGSRYFPWWNINRNNMFLIDQRIKGMRSSGPHFLINRHAYHAQVHCK